MTASVADILQLDEFLDSVWGKRVQRLGRCDVASKDALFEAVCSHCAHAVATGNYAGLRAHIDGRAVQDRRLAIVFPRATDESFSGYSARVDRELGPGREWGLILNDSHKHSARLAQQALGYFYPLVQRTGFPLSDYSAEVFIGRYGVSPVGIHQDIGLESFYWTVVGNKRLLLWEPGYWTSLGLDLPPLASELAPQEIDDATIVDLSEGELLYWPADYWHYAETPEFAVVLGVSLINPPDHARAQLIRQSVLTSLAALVDAADLETQNVELPAFWPVASGDAKAAAECIPAALIREATLVRRVVDGLYDEVANWWMGVCSNRGARVVAPPRLSGAACAVDDTLCRMDGACVLWRVNSAGNIVAAARGRIWACPNHAAYAELFRCVQTGVPFSLERVLAGLPERSSDTTDQQDVRRLARTLVDWDVVCVVQG